MSDVEFAARDGVEGDNKSKVNLDINNMSNIQKVSDMDGE